MKKASHGEDGVIKLNELLSHKDIPHILDIGAGKDEIHAKYLRSKGCTVDTIDFFDGATFEGDYNQTTFGIKYDGIHAAHVLEHQLNPNLFLQKIRYDLKEDGWLCITVPPLKHQIVGGHVSLWNAGLVLYHLVHARFNCSEAKIKVYGYNISVIVQKKSITETIPYTYNSKDITLIEKYLPKLNFRRNGLGELTFDGNIQRLNC